MSFLKSWQFRSSRPDFEEGETIELYATGFEPESKNLLARVGDSLLRVNGGTEDMVDRKLKVKVTEFDKSDSRGEAELLEAFESSEF